MLTFYCFYDRIINMEYLKPHYFVKNAVTDKNSRNSEHNLKSWKAKFGQNAVCSVYCCPNLDLHGSYIESYYNNEMCKFIIPLCGVHNDMIGKDLWIYGNTNRLLVRKRRKK